MFATLKAVFKNVQTGFIVLFSELKQGIIGYCQKLESKKVKQHLDREYIFLGQLFYKNQDKLPENLACYKDIKLCLTQIEFLEKDIKALAKRHEERRQMIAEERKQRLET